MAEIALAVAFISFIFAYLAVNIDQRHGGLQVLFLILSVFVATFDAVVLQKIAENQNLTSVANLMSGGLLKVLIFLCIIVVGYYLIFFIYNTLMKTTD